MANPNPSPATRFKPGNRANPGGRPKRRAVDDLLDLISEKKADRAVAEKWLEAIMSGDFRYMKEYLERRDGKVPDRVEADVTSGTQTLRDFLGSDDDQTEAPKPARKARKGR